MTVGVKFDRTLSLWPWPVRGRPYVALHVAHWGHYRYVGKYGSYEYGSHRVYFIGVMWGRWYVGRSGGSWWFSLVMPWRERDR